MADLIFTFGKKSEKKPEIGTVGNLVGTAGAIGLGFGANAIAKKFPSKRQKAVNEIKTKTSNLSKAQKSTNLVQRLGNLAVSQVEATSKAAIESRATDVAHAQGRAAKVKPSANDRARPFSKNVKYLGKNTGYGYGDPRFASPEAVKNVYEKKISSIGSSQRAAQKVFNQVLKPTSKNVESSMKSFKESKGMSFPEAKMPKPSNSNLTKTERVFKTLGKVAKFGGAAGVIVSGFSSTPLGDASIYKGFKQKEFKRNK